MACIWKHPNSRYWFARFTERSGRRTNRSTKIRVKGATPAETRKNRKKAARLADEFESAAREKRTIQQARRVFSDLTERLTGQRVLEKPLREYVAEWLNRKEPEVSAGTLENYSGVTDLFLRFISEHELADEDIGCITREHIIQFRNQRCKASSATTANKNIRILKQLFKHAMRDGLISDNPVEFVDSVRKAPKGARRGFTMPELRALLKVADSEWCSMVLFGLYTGQRLADIALLTWNNLDLEENEVRLTTRKTGKTLRIPLAHPLLDHLQKLPVSDDPDQPLHQRAYEKVQLQGRTNNLSNDFADLLFRAGLREKKVSHRRKEEALDQPSGEGRRLTRTTNALSFHSLRHTAVTVLHEAGVPMAIAQALIGHDSAAMHEVYIGVGHESLVDAATKFPAL